MKKSKLVGQVGLDIKVKVNVIDTVVTIISGAQLQSQSQIHFN